MRKHSSVSKPRNVGEKTAIGETNLSAHSSPYGTISNKKSLLTQTKVGHGVVASRTIPNNRATHTNVKVMNEKDLQQLLRQHRQLAMAGLGQSRDLPMRKSLHFVGKLNKPHSASYAPSVGKRSLPAEQQGIETPHITAVDPIDADVNLVSVLRPNKRMKLNDESVGLLHNSATATPKSSPLSAINLCRYYSSSQWNETHGLIYSPSNSSTGSNNRPASGHLIDPQASHWVKLRDYLKSGKNRANPAILLSGGSGVGKSAIAQYCLSQAGYNPILISASEAKSDYSTLRELFVEICGRRPTEDGKKYALVLDDVDAIFSSASNKTFKISPSSLPVVSGANTTKGDLSQATREQLQQWFSGLSPENITPIIITCTDFADARCREMRDSLCFHVKVQSPTNEQVENFAARILSFENSNWWRKLASFYPSVINEHGHLTASGLETRLDTGKPLSSCSAVETISGVDVMPVKRLRIAPPSLYISNLARICGGDVRQFMITLQVEFLFILYNCFQLPLQKIGKQIDVRDSNSDVFKVTKNLLHPQKRGKSRNGANTTARLPDPHSEAETFFSSSESNNLLPYMVHENYVNVIDESDFTKQRRQEQLTLLNTVASMADSLSMGDNMTAPFHVLESGGSHVADSLFSQWTTRSLAKCGGGGKRNFAKLSIKYPQFLLKDGVQSTMRQNSSALKRVQGHLAISNRSLFSSASNIDEEVESISQATSNNSSTEQAQIQHGDVWDDADEQFAVFRNPRAQILSSFDSSANEPAAFRLQFPCVKSEALDMRTYISLLLEEPLKTSGDDIERTSTVKMADSSALLVDINRFWLTCRLFSRV